MKIKINEKELNFEDVQLNFNKKIFINIFADYKNKTLSKTINTKKYANLCELVYKNYANSLIDNLGKFTMKLKQKNDGNYKYFLNNFGDLKYSTFKIKDERIGNNKGLYLYVLNKKIMYVGRCLSQYKTRINQGYGRIYPKNCYKDGQSTNCRLNYLITSNREKVRLLVCPLVSDELIKDFEKELIGLYDPKWNKSLRKKNI